MNRRNKPKLSGILPTRNRASYLPRVLDSLLNQSLDSNEFELVVVDDGSSDETPSILRRYTENHGNIFASRQSHLGISAAKNAAIAAAVGALIVFLDDDDVADPHLLEEHLAAHLEHPEENCAVLGYTSIERAISRLPLMHYVTEIGFQLFAYPTLEAGKVYGFREFWGGRSSCKRALLRGEPFNPAFRFGCEDIELAWRLRKLDLKVVYRPRAATQMIRSLDFADFCARSERQGAAQRAFFNLYPNEPEVRAYCEIDGAAELWRRKSAEFEHFLEITRKLHLAASIAPAAGLIADARLEKKLHPYYARAFRAFRAKGVIGA